MAKVRFVGAINNKVLDIPIGKIILDEALKNNIDLPYGCRYGSCFSCLIEVIKGIENIDCPNLQKINGSNNFYIQACMSRIKNNGDITIKV